MLFISKGAAGLNCLITCLALGPLKLSISSSTSATYVETKSSISNQTMTATTENTYHITCLLEAPHPFYSVTMNVSFYTVWSMPVIRLSYLSQSLFYRHV